MRVIAVVLALFVAAAVPARAEEISLKRGGLTLLAELTLAEGKTLADGVVLMTHGTLAHKDMEIMTALREALAKRGLSSLSISLSFNQDARRGMIDCAVPHTHKHTDAMAEIGVWLDWLKKQGAGSIDLLGHSRGGNQTAWFAAEHADAGFRKVVLLAPATYDAADAAKGFEKRYGAPLAGLLDKMKGLAAAGKGGEPVAVPGFVYCPDAKATPDAFLDYYIPDERFDTPSIVGRIKAPTLVIAAGDDTVVPDLEEKMAGKTSATVTFAVVDLADHMFQGFFIEDLGDQVAGFLAP